MGASCYLTRMSLLPDDDGLDLLHTRDYEVKVYRLSEGELLATVKEIIDGEE